MSEQSITINLLSGLFGAVIATLITIGYLYITEKIRRRYDIYLQVVAYLDEIYIRLQAVFAYTDDIHDILSDSKYDTSGLTEEDISATNRKIIELSLSHGIRSKVLAEYGNDNTLAKLSDLLYQYFDIYCLLRVATRPHYTVKGRDEVFDLFDKGVDPLRKQLQKQFREKCSIKEIIKDLYHKIFCSKKSPTGI